MFRSVCSPSPRMRRDRAAAAADPRGTRSHPAGTSSVSTSTAPARGSNGHAAGKSGTSLAFLLRMRVIVAAGALIFSTGVAFGAYLVELDGGDRMTVDSFWQEGERMHLVRGGVDVS